MAGTIGIASAIAHLAFWLLLVLAWVGRGTRTAVIFICLWLAGYFGLPMVDGALFFLSYVAVLDIALVFLVFRGDVRVF